MRSITSLLTAAGRTVQLRPLQSFRLWSAPRRSLSNLPSTTGTGTPPPGNHLPPMEDPLLSFLTNLIMRHGLKTKAQTHILMCLRTILLTTHSPPLPVLRRAIDLVSPAVKITRIKRGVKIFEVPKPLNERQRVRAGWNWMVEESDKRSEKELGRRLAGEVLNVIEGRSAVLEKTLAVHRRAAMSRSNLGKKF